VTVYILIQHYRATGDCGEEHVGTDIVGVFETLTQAKLAAMANPPFNCSHPA
jgi:hypothetical protein